MVAVRKGCGHSNVVLQVNVFYHETARGLLRCQENAAAVSQIQNKLLQYSILTSKLGVMGKCDRTGSVPDDDVVEASQFERGGSELGFSLFRRGSSSSTTSSSSNSESKSIWGPGE